MYAALGDSYSAGVGAGGSGGACRRSLDGFPPRLARAAGVRLSYLACAQARIDDVLAVQLPAVPRDAGLITLTCGGNDAGFARVVSRCLAPSWLFDTTADLADAATFIDDVLPGRLSALLVTVAAAAPDARVVLVGYPRITNGRDCHPLTFFSPVELTQLNLLADRLSEAQAAVAEAAGWAFVDVHAGFAGHAVCDAEPWLHGLTLPIADSFHPNLRGHEKLAALVGTRLGVAPVPAVPGAASPGAIGPDAIGPDAIGPDAIGPDATGQDAIVYGPCLRGSAPAISVAALAGTQSLRAAAAIGLDASRIAALAATLDDGDPAAAEAAATELRDLSDQVAQRRS